MSGRWHSLALLSGILLLTGCEKAAQDMYQQPRYDPLEPSPLFADGRSARTPPAGSIPLRAGRLADASGGLRGSAVAMPSPPAEHGGPHAHRHGEGSEQQQAPNTRLPTGVPFPVTAAIYRRGQERYEIFCAPCHSPLGDGDGMVVRRGFPAPPSLHLQRLREVPDQHLFQVISEGYGAMYAYADRLAPEERWAVVAYIRALQLSQRAPLSLLDAKDRSRLKTDGERHE